MIVKKRKKGVPYQKKKLRFSVKKHFLIISLFFIVLLTIGGYFLINQDGSTVGQAYYLDVPERKAIGADCTLESDCASNYCSPETNKCATNPKGNNFIWFDFAKGTAAPGDTFPVVVKFNTIKGVHDAKSASFNLEFDSDFEVTGIKQGPGFSLVGTPTKNVNNLNLKKDANFMALSGGIGGPGKVLATINLKVIGSYDKSEPSHDLKVKMTYFQFDDKGVAKDIPLVSKIATAKITIVPPCKDDDLDGWGAPGTNLKGCSGVKSGTNFNKLAQTKEDCDPNDGTIYPGATESCDGKDNDCNKIDDDIKKEPNSGNLMGVCSGYKVCAKIDGAWKKVDSFEVETKNNKGNFHVKDQAELEITTSLGTKSKVSLKMDDETGSKCDYVDNDCDNAIDEGLKCESSVKIPKGLLKKGKFLPGNAHYEYNVDGTFDDQSLLIVDINMLGYLRSVIGDNSLGGENQFPMNQLLKEKELFVCDDGIYYKERDKIVYEHSYDKDEKKTIYQVKDSELFTDGTFKSKVTCPKVTIK